MDNHPEYEKVRIEFFNKTRKAIVSNWLARYRLDPDGSSEEGKWDRLCSHRETINKFSEGNEAVLVSWGLTEKEISHILETDKNK